MRSCHEVLEVLLRSTSTAKQKEAATAALAEVKLTARVWRTAVSALPALAELIQKPSGSAAMREQAVRALDHIKGFEHSDNDHVEAAATGVIASIVELLMHDAICV